MTQREYPVPPRFVDGKTAISFDRTLIRWVNMTQIALALVSLLGAIVGAWWGTLQLVRAIDRINNQISILQQQQSSFQNLLVNTSHSRARHPADDSQ